MPDYETIQVLHEVAVYNRIMGASLSHWDWQRLGNEESRTAYETALALQTIYNVNSRVAADKKRGKGK
jgi:hypothetical protein